MRVSLHQASSSLSRASCSYLLHECELVAKPSLMHSVVVPFLLNLAISSFRVSSGTALEESYMFRITSAPSHIGIMLLRVELKIGGLLHERFVSLSAARALLEVRSSSSSLALVRTCRCVLVQLLQVPFCTSWWFHPVEPCAWPHSLVFLRQVVQLFDLWSQTGPLCQSLGWTCR